MPGEAQTGSSHDVELEPSAAEVSAGNGVPNTLPQPYGSKSTSLFTVQLPLNTVPSPRVNA
jgi:hypothetical protein